MLPTLSECLGRAGGDKFEALDRWLAARGDAALCVGRFREHERRCSVRVGGRTFTAIGRGEGFGGTWAVVLAAMRKAERDEQ